MKRIMLVLSAAAVMAMVLAVMAAPAMAKKKITCPEGSTLTTNVLTGEPACQVPTQVEYTDEGHRVSCPAGATVLDGRGAFFQCLVEPVSKKEPKDKE